MKDFDAWKPHDIMPVTVELADSVAERAHGAGPGQRIRILLTGTIKSVTQTYSDEWGRRTTISMDPRKVLMNIEPADNVFAIMAEDVDAFDSAP